jgi:hypothetical protein
MIRLRPEGSRDRTFDDDGVQTLRYPGGSVAFGREIEPALADRYVIAVEVLRSGGGVGRSVDPFFEPVGGGVANVRLS